MTAQLGRLFRSARVRGLLSYPFRLEPADSNWASSPFTGLAIVDNLSTAGDTLVTVALAGSIFVSVSLNAARGRTALGLIATLLPFAVVGPFIGPFVDRWRGGRRLIVFVAALGRVGAALMMASWIHRLLLFPAAFLSLVGSKTHSVASSSLVPGVVEREGDLVRANSRLAVGSSLTTSIVALVGSGIYKVLGSTALLHLDVLVFTAVAGLSLHLLARRPRTARPSETNNPSPHAVGTSQAAPVVVTDQATTAPEPRPARRHGVIGRFRSRPKPYVPKQLACAAVALAGMRATAGLLTALVVFAFRRQSTPVIWYGLVAIASVGGNLAGALVAPRLHPRLNERTLICSAAVLITGAAVAVTQLGAADRRPAALTLAAAVALGASTAKTAFNAIVQRDTHDADRSRLFARFNSLFQTTWVIGALIPTLIATPLLAGFILTAAIVAVTSSVFVTLVARRPPVGPRNTDAPPGDQAP